MQEGSFAGQCDSEDAALARRAVGLDAPAVCFHRPARDGQAQSETAAAVSVLPAAGGIDPVETVEDMRQVLRRNAFALIADADFGICSCCGTGWPA
jgi:hypothetical protein